MSDRFVLRCPNLRVHDRVLEMVAEHGRVVVDNAKRLSIAAELDDLTFLGELEDLGVQVYPDARQDPDLGR